MFFLISGFFYLYKFSNETEVSAGSDGENPYKEVAEQLDYIKSSKPSEQRTQMIDFITQAMEDDKITYSESKDISDQFAKYKVSNEKLIVQGQISSINGG